MVSSSVTVDESIISSLNAHITYLYATNICPVTVNMTIITQLEELSNEIFLDILEYLDGYDILFAFASLNSRISLILYSTRLRVNIDFTHCRHQIEFLSHYLKFYSDQVVSLQVHDVICDQENIIAYLFNRHDFSKLQYCVFYSIKSSSNLKIVFEKLSKLTKIVSFRIIQSRNVEEDKLNTFDAHNFSQLILIETPSTLCSADLCFHHNHSQIATTSVITTNLTHLRITFYGTLNDISIYSLLPLLRIHVALRSLCVTIKSTEVADLISGNVPNLPFINEDGLPKSLLLKSFGLQLVMARCNIDSIRLILRRMPNLDRLGFTLIADRKISQLIMELVDGENWREMLTNHVPYLRKFDFHISLLKLMSEPIDLDNIVNSFRCFVNVYHQWDMCISRWKYIPAFPLLEFEHIHLWTLNHSHLTTQHEDDIPSITNIDSFDIRSTNISSLNDRNRNFYHQLMRFFMARDTVIPAVQLPLILPFQNVNRIACHLACPYLPALSLLNNTIIRLKRILSLYTKDDDDSQKYLDNLSRLINLSNIDTVQFLRNNDITRLHVIEHVLLACPNVKTLIIDSLLLFSSEVLNNPALTLIFNQLIKIRILTDHMYFPSKYASRFVQRFPSLTIVEMELYSIDTSIPIVDIFLSGLAKLRVILIHFTNVSLLDDPFSRNYVIYKRRQSFGLSQSDEDKVVVEIEDKTLYIGVA